MLPLLIGLAFLDHVWEYTSFPSMPVWSISPSPCSGISAPTLLKTGIVIHDHFSIRKDMIYRTIRQLQVKGRDSMRSLSREVCWAKNSLTREHGWSPVALVFGREPRVYGELHQDGNPTGFHFDVGEADSDVATRMRFRYHAKMEFIKSQARNMLLKTAHHRTRKIAEPQVGQLVFFWRADRSKARDSQSKWVGPGYVVGRQGHNAWISCGGRCFLVAGEHLLEAIGDEQNYGSPDVQKALALFRRVSKEETSENLVGQEGPQTESMDIETQPLASDVIDESADQGMAGGPIPERLQKLSHKVGWHVDTGGEAVLVSHRVWAMRTQEPKYNGQQLPLRTTWVFMCGEWKLLENEVNWTTLDDPNAFFPNGPAGVVVTVFHNKTRKEACLDDVPQEVKRRRKQDPASASSHEVHVVGHDKVTEKEGPYDRIPREQSEAYRETAEKEWKSWQDYDSVEALTLEESKKIEQECPDRVFRVDMCSGINMPG